MKKGILKMGLFSVFLLLLISCSKDLDDTVSLLGTWVETDPVEGRTTLHFSPGNKLVKIDADGNAEHYTYRIEDNTLFLTLASDMEVTAEVYFEQINVDRIKTGDLYVSIPENEPTFIIFERE